jgi:hypothetical protein
MAGNASDGYQSGKAMSDRWQYVVGAIISLVLAMAYLTLTDAASFGGGRETGGSTGPDQALETALPKAPSGAKFEASPSVAPGAMAPGHANRSNMTPEVGSLSAEPELMDGNAAPQALALPSAASSTVGQAAAQVQANSESPALDSEAGP